MKEIRDAILEFDVGSVVSVSQQLPPFETMGYSVMPTIKGIGGLLKAKGRALVAKKLIKSVPGVALVHKPKVISARKQLTLKRHKPH